MLLGGMLIAFMLLKMILLEGSGRARIDDRNCGLGHGRECLSRPKKANSRRCNRWPWEPLIMLFDEVFPARLPGLRSYIWRHKKAARL